eukprot:264996-Chlamydomonas_euryale.AAC.3
MEPSATKRFWSQHQFRHLCAQVAVQIHRTCDDAHMQYTAMDTCRLIPLSPSPPLWRSTLIHRHAPPQTTTTTRTLQHTLGDRGTRLVCKVRPVRCNQIRLHDRHPRVVGMMCV